MVSLKKLITIPLAIAALTGAVTANAQTDTAASGASAQPTKKQARTQNHELEKKIRHTLTKTKHLDSSGITILVKGGKVTLEGSAPDDDQIQRAVSTVSGVPGVTGVTNNLMVHEPGN
jgi:hyperosmotically inducible protein